MITLVISCITVVTGHELAAGSLCSLWKICGMTNATIGAMAIAENVAIHTLIANSLLCNRTRAIAHEIRPNNIQNIIPKIVSLRR